jgi:hypothetical protein
MTQLPSFSLYGRTQAGDTSQMWQRWPRYRSNCVGTIANLHRCVSRVLPDFQCMQFEGKIISEDFFSPQHEQKKSVFFCKLWQKLYLFIKIEMRLRSYWGCGSEALRRRPPQHYHTYQAPHVLIHELAFASHNFLAVWQEQHP